ncbi:alpha/beta hydrolase [Streptomyces sp. NPDC004074]|uniref:alpha/beta fold hydrolase n=1 Tax=Streptomyces sp. NPDC004074 TaxID=3154277 RepID=UPI0033BB9287
MIATSPYTAPYRRTAIVLSAAAVMGGALVGCGHSNTPATDSASPAKKAGTTATASTLHMIENKGHRLAFHVTPGHGPVIVLDAGGGEDSSYWKKLVPALAKETGSKIITYDRAGMGASEAVPGPWKAQNAVSDLEAGLTALGATHDVVLVSHSEAGEIATYFTREHPEQMAGAVLVDASLPEFYTDTETARVAAASQAQVDALKGHAKTKADRQLLAVAANFVPAHHAYHRIGWPASVPATVIASAQTPFPTSAPDAKAWRDAQARFAHAATNRKFVVAANSSHDIPVDRPDVVEAQVTALVKALR